MTTRGRRDWRKLDSSHRAACRGETDGTTHRPRADSTVTGSSAVPRRIKTARAGLGAVERWESDRPRPERPDRLPTQQRAAELLRAAHSRVKRREHLERNAGLFPERIRRRNPEGDLKIRRFSCCPNSNYEVDKTFVTPAIGPSNEDDPDLSGMRHGRKEHV